MLIFYIVITVISITDIPNIEGLKLYCTNCDLLT